MGFFKALRRVLGGHDGGPGAADPGLARAWGLESPDAAAGGEYDRGQWVKKLKRVLDGLPGTRGEWPALAVDAEALGLEPEWVTKCQTEEFLMMVRRAVSDRHFTEEEHRKLDLARDLIGIPEAEAEAALHAIVAEAETFFGKPVEDA